MRISSIITGITLSVLSLTAVAQNVSGFTDTQDGTFTVRAPDGTLVVADAASERIYISDINGSMAELTFAQAIDAGEPDPSRRSALLAAIRAGLVDPLAEGAFAIPVQPYQPEPNPCPDNGANPGGGEIECQLQGAGSITTQQGGGAEGELPKPTDLETITVTAMRPEVIVNTGGGVFYSRGVMGEYDNPGGYVPYQQYWADDYNRWKKNRSMACDAAQVQSFMVAGSVLLAGASCTGAAASGGVAGAACGGAVVVLMGSWAQMMASQQTCVSAYPGPGNW